MVEQAKHSQLDSSNVGKLDQDAFELKRMMRAQAHERSFEISVQAQRYFETEKGKEVQRGFDLAQADHDKRVKQMQTNSQIAKSKKANEYKLTLMKEREICVQDVKKLTLNQLQSQFNPSDPQYRVTMKNLIIQGMIKLIEAELVLKVREEDISLVEGLLEECEEEYSTIMHRATKRDEYKTSLRVLKDKFLTPEERGSCGGVILYAHKFRIVCSNTLEERLELSFEMALPKIRQVLFPVEN